VTILSQILLFFRRHLSSVLRLLSNLSRQPATSCHFDYVLGFGSSRVPAGQHLVVHARPNVAFRPERLAIPLAVASNFLLVDVTIAGRRQLGPVGAVPASLFGGQSYNPCLRMDVALSSDDVSVEVFNESDEDQVFQCALCGPVS
jgi:hypothetical protein